MKTFTLIVFYVLLASCSRQSHEGVDLWSKRLTFLDQEWLPLGPAQVSDNSSGLHIVSGYQYKVMKCLASAGYLRLLKDEDLTDGNFHGFNNSLSSVQSHIIRNIETEMTLQGEVADANFDENGSHTDSLKRSTNKNDYFRVRTDKSNIMDVLENREIEKNGDKYRLISFRYKKIPTDIGEKMIAVGCRGDVRNVDFNIRTLLKWNVFRRAWEISAVDATNDEKPFNTSNVENVLR